MDAINRLLISGANAILGLWEGAYAISVDLLLWIEGVLNPIASPVLGFLNPICTSVGDVTYLVLSALPVWFGLAAISVFCGTVTLFLFRHTSNQPAIRKVKNDIKANLLALKLYNQDMGVTLATQARLFMCVLRLQFHMLRPLLVMLPPMLLLLGQMGTRYQQRPLRSGEQALLIMKYDSEAISSERVSLETNPGLHVEAGPVPGGGSIVWRIRAGQVGRHNLRFDVGGTKLGKELVVSDRFDRVSAVRPGHDWTAQILHPAEPRLPAESPVRSIEVTYPARSSVIHGSDWWILSFFVVSMLTAVVLKPVFRVQF